MKQCAWLGCGQKGRNHAVARGAPSCLVKEGGGGQGGGKHRPDVELASQESQSEHWVIARISSSVNFVKVRTANPGLQAEKSMKGAFQFILN